MPPPLNADKMPSYVDPYTGQKFWIEKGGPIYPMSSKRDYDTYVGAIKAGIPIKVGSSGGVSAAVTGDLHDLLDISGFREQNPDFNMPPPQHLGYIADAPPGAKLVQSGSPQSAPSQLSGLLPAMSSSSGSYADRAQASMSTTMPRYAGNYSSVPESMMPSWMRSGNVPADPSSLAPAPTAPASTGHNGLLPALDREHSTVPEHLLPSWMRGQASGESDMIPPEWRGGTGG